MDYQKYFNKNGCCVGLVNELTTNIQFCARSHANPDVVIIPPSEMTVEPPQTTSDLAYPRHRVSLPRCALRQ